MGGNDTISGGSDTDILCGGDGNDTLNGGSGNDTIVGGDGDDQIDAGSGADTVWAGDGLDVVDAGSGADEVHGGSGDDILNGDSGGDLLDGGSGVDSLDGGSGTDTCEPEAGRVSCEVDLAPGGGPGVAETIISRAYAGDRLLTDVTVTNPDGTVDLYGFTWDRNAPIPQIVSVNENGVVTSLVYRAGRAFAVDPGGAATGFEYSVLGDVTAGPLTVSSGFDPYGLPDDENVLVGFGYRGELHVGGLVNLRSRDLDPTLGRFTTTDPVNGVPGTTTATNQYAYAGNDPVGMVDPQGLRPKDRELLRFIVNGGGFAGFEDLGTLEVAGFIPAEVSDFFGIGLYLGDDRPFAQNAIPADQSRFFARIDFETGEGVIRVTDTISADGEHFPAWPIVFNANGAGVPNDWWNQKTNYFSLGRSTDGTAIRLDWSVVHGDRRFFAGPFFTVLQRPSMDGSLTVRRLSEASVQVTYAGDCFPSVEAQLLPPGGGRLRAMQFESMDPASGQAIAPNCTKEELVQLP